jgi:hypothetical protein
MNFKTIALATAFALSSTFVLAQAGGAGGAGAEVPEKTGTAANAQGGVVGTTTNGATMTNGTGTGAGSTMSNGREPKEKMGNGTSSGAMTK